MRDGKTIATEATGKDPRASAPAQQEPRSELNYATKGETSPRSIVKIPQDRYGRKVLDPRIHSCYRKGKGWEPRWTEPNEKGERFWKIKPGPGTKPPAQSVIRDPASNGKSGEEIEPNGANSPATQPTTVADDGESLDPYQVVAMVEEGGIALGGADAAMSAPERDRMARAISRYDQANPGALPRLSPGWALVLVIGGYLVKVVRTEQGTATMMFAALEVQAWWSGRPAVPPAPPASDRQEGQAA